MGLRRPQVEVLLQAAALHEVGRLAGSQSAAASQEKACGAGEEWSPAAALAAERILAPITSLREARDTILRSADQFDAAPTPFGSDRPGIPIESRILGTCEEFVRLAPADGQSAEQTREALEVIQERAGSRHNPEVVAALCRVVEKSLQSVGGVA